VPFFGTVSFTTDSVNAGRHLQRIYTKAWC